MPGYLYNLLNIGVSLVGYYMAFLFVDDKRYGRRKMQAIGFFMDFILFVIPAFAYDSMTKPGPGVKAFQALYFLSSFFAQL